MKTTANNKIVRMATLIRKALTEVRNVKSLMDIPEMKRERDAIREKMSTNAEEIERQKMVMTHNASVDRAIAGLSELNQLAFFPNGELLGHSNLILNYLTETRDKSSRVLADLDIAQKKMTNELDKITAKIKTTRTPV